MALVHANHSTAVARPDPHDPNLPSRPVQSFWIKQVFKGGDGGAVPKSSCSYQGYGYTYFDFDLGTQHPPLVIELVSEDQSDAVNPFLMVSREELRAPSSGGRRGGKVAPKVKRSLLDGDPEAAKSLPKYTSKRTAGGWLSLRQKYAKSVSVTFSGGDFVPGSRYSIGVYDYKGDYTLTFTTGSWAKPSSGALARTDCQHPVTNVGRWLRPSDGAQWDGQWTNQAGQGVIDYVDGSRYRGFWIKCSRVGHGALTYGRSDLDSAGQPDASQAADAKTSSSRALVATGGEGVVAGGAGAAAAVRIADSGGGGGTAAARAARLRQPAGSTGELGGHTFEGMWKDDKRVEKGKRGVARCSYLDGSVYDGQWMSGVRC